MAFNHTFYTGYLRAEDVVRLARNNMAGRTKASGTVNAYASPDTGSPVVRTIAANTVISLRGYVEKPSGNFHAIVNGTNYAYIPESELTITTEGIFTAQNMVLTPANPGGGLTDYLYQFVGDPATDKRLTKTLNLGGEAGDTYMVNAWGYGKSMPQVLANSPRRYGVKVVFVAEDAGTDDDVHEVNFSPDQNEWQFLAEACIAGVRYKQIQVSYQYCHQSSNVWMTGLSLFREEFGRSYTYDSDGNITRTADIEKNMARFEYSASQDLTGLIDPKGHRDSFVYDPNHNVTNAVSAAGVRTRNVYDSNGNVTRTGVYDPAATSIGTWVDRTFTSDGNHVSSVTDAAGHTTAYSWNLQKDRLGSVTDPAGKTTSYTYDIPGRLTKASMNIENSQTAEVTYAYEDDRLKTVTHNGFSYSFAWDRYGNADSVRIGGQRIIRYEYESNNGNLLKKIYENGDHVRYEYDGQDRVSEVYTKHGTAQEVQRFTYLYDREGRLARVTDLLLNKAWKLYYDLSGLLCQSQCSDGGQYSYTYDANGNLAAMAVYEGGRLVKTAYAYDQDDRESQVSIGTVKRETIYDAFGRADELRWLAGSTVKYRTSYIYDDSSATRRHGLVRELHNRKEGGSDQVTKYEYDSRCNITKITLPDNTIIMYGYDSRNQLVRENNQARNRTYVYTYDLGGNMTSRKEYLFTAGSIPSTATPISTVNGVYGDTNWKDKLTKWDNKPVTYDACGNMTSYDGKTYTWARGRLLASVSDAGGTIASYEYNERGLRVKKTVGNTVTTYCWAGDLLLAQKTGSEVIYFFYDSAAQPVGFQIGTVPYYYVKNIQGDIIGIVDAEGTEVVKYVYDAWGKILSVSGTAASTVGDKNPLRYRGYYYDREIEFYYICFRYYSPSLCRFISIDDIKNTIAGILNCNQHVYCGNNPVSRVDIGGRIWETVFDVISLGFSIIETIQNPVDPWAWGGLIGDIIDLIPFVTGAGETTKALGTTIKILDKTDDTYDMIHVVKATDFTDEALETIRGLDKVGDATRSSLDDGWKIHNGYKKGYDFIPDMKKEATISGGRIDFFDKKNRIIYELKPNNPRGIRDGVRQLKKYNKAVGGGTTMFLEVY